MSDAAPKKKLAATDWAYILLGGVMVMFGLSVIWAGAIKRGNEAAYDRGYSDAYWAVADAYWDCSANPSRDCRELVVAVRVLSPDQRKRKD